MSDPGLVPIRRALISVSDKTGLVDLGRFLAGLGIEILSTGGSARALREAAVPVTEVSDHTGFPEMMDGRVKTLHPRIHGGILALRDAPGHRDDLARHGIAPIDLVVVNLYPFEETVRSGADAAASIEMIDIGGPALIRAGAKNHAFVTVVVAPSDYGAVREEMARHRGATTLGLRQALAAKAYASTASYDAAIAGWFSARAGDAWPGRLLLSGLRGEMLRYGENSHQEAAFYRGGEGRPGVGGAVQVQGKALSYNNLNDTDAAYELVAEFDPEEAAAVAIIKHANPCGVALAPDLAAAYARALGCDPSSAFGGIVALNRPLDGGTAAEIAKLFIEVIIAPDADEDARRLLSHKESLRLLLAGALPDPAAPGRTVRSVAGGYLVQSRDSGRVGAEQCRAVTRRRPSDREMADLLFAFRVAKHVKSNAIVYAREGATVGIGAGQMSRVDAARLAARKSADAARAAGETASRTAGAVAASDAFFPFADGLLAVAEAGATAVIQPGGSVRDEEVIAAADEAGLAMVFTGMRHFRH